MRVCVTRMRVSFFFLCHVCARKTRERMCACRCASDERGDASVHGGERRESMSRVLLDETACLHDEVAVIKFLATIRACLSPSR